MMNRGYRLWLCLLAFCLCLAGKTVQAETGSFVSAIYINGEPVNMQEDFWLGAKDMDEADGQIRLSFFGEGDEKILLCEKGESDLYEEKTLIYQELTEEEYVLATGKMPEQGSFWKAKYVFEADADEYFFEMKGDGDSAAIAELPVIHIDRDAPKTEVESCSEGFCVRMEEEYPDFLNMAGGIWRKTDKEAEEVFLLPAEEFIWEKKEGAYIAELPIYEEGLYELKLTVLDLAGNEGEIIKQNLCVDRTAPDKEGLYVFSGGQELSAVNKNYYANAAVLLQIPVKDAVSGICSASVYLKETGKEDYEKTLLKMYSFEEPVNHSVLEAEIVTCGFWEVGICMEDQAGNGTKDIAWIGSITIEEEEPAVSVDISGKRGENDYYTEGVTISVTAEDAISGICGAELVVNGQTVKKWKAEDAGMIIEETYTLSASAYGGEIPICFYVQDLAGNTSTCERVIKMDARMPVMELEWRSGAASNGIYYNKQRKAVLKVWETNFDETGISIINGSKELDKPVFTKVSGEDCYVTELVFSEDGLYELQVRGKDLAGNFGDVLTEDRFVIDRTRPVIWVNYEDEEYGKEAFCEERSAGIIIREDNPDMEKLELHIFLDGKEESLTSEMENIYITEAGISGKILFNKEGNYYWSLQMEDLAGNRSVLWESDEFYLDFTEPVLTLNGVNNKGSVNGEVMVSVEGEDSYISGDSLEVAIYRDGIRFEPESEMRSYENRQVLFIEAFPIEEAWDGHYRIEAACEDQAGNRTKEEWHFTVNRFGSEISLGNEFQKAVTNYYVNKVPLIVLSEKNPDILTEQTLFFQDEKGMRLLTREKEYSVTHREDGNGWQQYIYEIAPEVFQSDGICELSLHTKDAAGNVMDSRTVTAMRFFLDRKGPNIQLEEPSKHERTAKVYISGKSPVQEVVFWLNGEQISSYTEKDIQEAGGIFRIYPQDTDLSGMLVIEARDAAGNYICTDPMFLQGLMENDNTIEAEKERLERTETKRTSESIWVLVWIFVICIVFCMLIVHFIKKQKENKDNSC